jgi:ferritin-like metal-binding protein YciE
MALSTVRDLFIHELSHAISAEQQMLQLLPEWQAEALNHEVKEALTTHERETQQQVTNLQAVFQQLGATPRAIACYPAEGILAEHKALHKEQPSPEVLEIANLDAVARAEHYELAMYTSLVQMARDLGEDDADQLLQDNLDQERTMAVRVETLARELGKLQAQTMLAGARGGGR